MNKAVVGAIAGVAIVGVAGAGAVVYPQMRAKSEVQAAFANLPKGIQGSYKTVDYSLFGDKLTIGGIELAISEQQDTVTTRLDKLTISKAGKTSVGQMLGSGVSVEVNGADGRFVLNANEMAVDQVESSDGNPLTLGALNDSAAIPTVNVKRFALTGVTLDAAGEKAQLGEVFIADLVQRNKAPISLTMGLHGLVVDRNTLPDESSREGLTKLGYDKLLLNFDLSYAHAVETQRLSIKNASVSSDGVGKLSLSADLGGIPALASDDPMQAMAATQMATLERLELRYEDASLANRLLKAAAADSGMSEAQMKEMLLTELTQGAEGEQVPLVKDVVNSAGAFLANPKSLTLQMQPAQPVAIAALMMGAGDPYAAAETLGAKVFANK
ncbi:MAG TPA: hypothetical protein VK196_18610 [Magnetospirillum sp.]|nr:hypothetical protein [Magnetospirillum sp.]